MTVRKGTKVRYRVGSGWGRGVVRQVSGDMVTIHTNKGGEVNRRTALVTLMKDSPGRPTPSATPVSNGQIVSPAENREETHVIAPRPAPPVAD